MQIPTSRMRSTLYSTYVLWDVEICTALPAYIQTSATVHSSIPQSCLISMSANLNLHTQIEGMFIARMLPINS